MSDADDSETLMDAMYNFIKQIPSTNPELVLAHRGTIGWLFESGRIKI